MTIGETIKYYRKLNKMTQKRLSELSSVAPGTVQQYESGKRQPRIEPLTRIASSLNLKLSDFLEPGQIIQQLNEDNTYETITKKEDGTLEKKINTFVSLPKNIEEVEDMKEGLLLEEFRKLNNTGKRKAIEFIEDLAYIEKYIVQDK